MTGQGDVDVPQKQFAIGLHGQVAIASARIAYQIYKEIFNAERFQELADNGARTQRLLWASTSTKNPAYNFCITFAMSTAKGYHG